MRILVQDCKTLEYLLPNGTRTRDAVGAHNYLSTIDALNFCQKSNDPNLQILMKFEKDEFDVALPVSANCKQAVAAA